MSLKKIEARLHDIETAKNNEVISHINKAVLEIINAANVLARQGDKDWADDFRSAGYDLIQMAKKAP